MKIFYTGLLFFFLVNLQLGFGQFVSLTNSNIHFDFEVDESDYYQDIDAKLTLQYTGEDTVRIVWERNIHSLPDGWETAVCDPNLCYQPGVSTESFIVVPNQIFDLAVHVYPRKIQGDSGKVSVTLYEESNPEETFEYTYSFENSTMSSVSDKSGSVERPSIYPNPAEDHFFIKNDESVVIVEIYNLVGQLVQRRNYLNSKQVNVSDLHPGMYFIKLLDPGHRIIRTLRLNKR